MNIDEAKIYEPLENSNLVSIIPEDERILYSGIFEIFEITKKKGRSHIILTDKGVAISSSENIPVQIGCGVRSGDLYYFPWIVARRDERYTTRLAVGNFNFRIENLEGKRQIDARDREFREIFDFLIKQSKDELYEKLVPVLQTWPKNLYPQYNTLRFPMPIEVYNELKFRYLKDVSSGKIKPGSKIKPIPKNTYYNRERIIEEFKNYNFEPGSYTGREKTEEMVTVFANFFGNHSIEDASNLVLELFEINPFFAGKWYPKMRAKTVGLFPKKEKEFYEFERTINELLFFDLIFKDDEYVIVDFKGQVNLPNAYLEYPGHIYLTNYQLLSPKIPKTKLSMVISNRSQIFSPLIPGRIGIAGIAGLAVAGIAGIQKAVILKARKKFDRVFTQNPDMFHIKHPYDIELHDKDYDPYNIRFTMNYNYYDEDSQEPKIYKHTIAIKIKKFDNTSLEEYKQKRKEVVSKFADYFSSLPNTACPKCLNIQDKSLKKCEKCGEKINIQF